MRAETLATHARAMTLLSDQLVHAAHSGDQQRIEHLIGQAARLLPPHGFHPMTVLAVVLALQVDRDRPLEQRIGWAAQFDPTLEEATT